MSRGDDKNWHFISYQDPEERNSPEYRRLVRSQAARHLDHRREARPLQSQTPQARRVSSSQDALMSDEDHYARHALIASTDSNTAFATGGIDPFAGFPTGWRPYFVMAVDHFRTCLASILPVTDSDLQQYISTGFMTLAIQTPALFHVITLFSYSHYKELLKGTSHDNENEAVILHWLRQQSLQGVNEFVQSSDTELSTSDAALASVHILAWYEFCFGSMDTNREHVAGLKTLVQLRGGLNGPSIHPQLAEMLRWADQERSRITREPQYLTGSPSPSRLPPLEAVGRWSGGRIPLLPVRSGLRVLCNHGHSSARCPELAIIVRRLSALIVGIKERHSEPFTEADRPALIAETNYLDTRLTEITPPRLTEVTPSRTSPTNASRREEQAHNISFEYARVASLSICFGLKQEFGHLSNHHIRRERRNQLFLASQDIREMPAYAKRILLWALFASACNVTAHDSSLLHLLKRLLRDLEIDDWGKITETLETFPWLEHHYHSKCFRLWQQSITHDV
ncbi:MAG: hypothetical protein M1828_000495 [Chrysothrix sp. TS-e1954]|nr:MAG: hypothetical protein M1828_000495 [Chrysothrix sp. TS-e1954]